MVSAILTVLVIAAVILANSVFGSLAGRYEWYSYMTAEANYDVTSVCYSLLDKKLSASDPDQRKGDVRILFCDTEEVWKEDPTQSFSIIPQNPSATDMRTYPLSSMTSSWIPIRSDPIPRTSKPERPLFLRSRAW